MDEKEPRGRLKRFVGNRQDILLEISFLAYYMLPFCLEYLDLLTKDVKKSDCQLHPWLGRKTGTAELEAEVRAAGILWYHLIQPLRVATHSTTANLHILDFNMFMPSGCMTLPPRWRPIHPF